MESNPTPNSITQLQSDLEKTRLADLSETTISDKNSEATPTEQKPTLAKRGLESLMAEIKAIVAINHMRNDGRPAEIIPGLYLGSVGAALSKKTLLGLGITHVLSVMDKMKTPYPNDFSYKQIEILDSVQDDIRKHFEDASLHIDNVLKGENNKILVHCFAGKSRSTTIVICYLMKYHGMKRDEALDDIRKKRPIVCPNAGFMLQLKEWEKLLSGTTEVGTTKVGTEVGTEVGNIEVGIIEVEEKKE